MKTFLPHKNGGFDCYLDRDEGPGPTVLGRAYGAQSSHHSAGKEMGAVLYREHASFYGGEARGEHYHTGSACNRGEIQQENRSRSGGPNHRSLGALPGAGVEREAGSRG